MQKELNPELFGSQSTQTLKSVLTQADQKVFEVKQHLNLLSEQVAKMVAQMNEYIKTSHSKMERMQVAVSKLENNLQQMAEQSGLKMSSLSQRLSERKSLDSKIQDMIDRHNNVLRSYEMRMSNLQKMIGEKEAQIMQAQSTLNEAKMEIVRLKRL